MITVSHHAMFRYMERVLGIDIDRVRQEIIELAAPDSPDSERIVLEESRDRDGLVVVTILGDGMRKKKTRAVTGRQRVQYAPDPVNIAYVAHIAGYGL